MTVSSDSYLFKQSWEHERARLGGLSTQYDAVTIRHLGALGVAPGWRCLELGAGAGSIARWLAGAVGPGGRVVATDLDTRFLVDLPSPPVEVRRHDVTADPLEPGAFDLIHARALFEHLPGRLEVLGRVSRALRPGGVLLVEDAVFGVAFNPAATRLTRPAAAGPLYARVMAAVSAGFGAIGADSQFGLDLPEALARAGLVDVDAEFTARWTRGGSPEAAFYDLTLREVGPRLVTAGLLTDRDLTEMLAFLADPASRFSSLGVVSAWGRTP